MYIRTYTYYCCCCFLSLRKPLTRLVREMDTAVRSHTVARAACNPEVGPSGWCPERRCSPYSLAGLNYTVLGQRSLYFTGRDKPHSVYREPHCPKRTTSSSTIHVEVNPRWPLRTSLPRRDQEGVSGDPNLHPAPSPLERYPLHNGGCYSYHRSSINSSTRDQKKKVRQAVQKAIGWRLATLCGASLWPRRHAPRPPRYVWRYGGFQREQWLQSAVHASSARAAHHFCCTAHPMYIRTGTTASSTLNKKMYCVLYYFQVFFVFGGKLPEKK